MTSNSQERVSAAVEPLFVGSPCADWTATTRGLIQQHPLFSRPEELLGAVGEAWQVLWKTTIGLGELSVPLAELDLPAQVIGEFFETLLAKKLGLLQMWRRGEGREKDLVYLGAAPRPGLFDFELKVSGQEGGKIFGNRSYAQPNAQGDIDSPGRKDRSGYYLTINFLEKAIYQIRVGWLDARDWQPQASATGQMASLKPYVYEHKLVPMHGHYRLEASVRCLGGVGPKAGQALEQGGLRTIGDVLALLGRIEMVFDSRQSRVGLRKSLKSAMPDADASFLKALVTALSFPEMAQDATLLLASPSIRD
ncbi:ScaI family restriction endonuclease [Myxococcus sp. AM010]|uniref:ScaI family restriction endonuclease n=1 Tax=Myxococcus sp. AM010 TaxID=2745138 RepID=UPI001595591C|nr:ScaI family restriction endonuclease [Myxococcus sp. AM010]NVJ15174.1 ScaI family restriction endonuclease [Myxococcus sp. AM010]